MPKRQRRAQIVEELAAALLNEAKDLGPDELGRPKASGEPGLMPVINRVVAQKFPRATNEEVYLALMRVVATLGGQRS
jgi:hypothetical protein